ncbi:MAG: hypothetical protein K2N23_01180, partial [Clostridia bacterium]|nr:hypothetical protein [Clostridia bacterium]
ELRNLRVKFNKFKVNYYGSVSEEKDNFYISEALGTNNNGVDNVIQMLEEFYSPIQKENIRQEKIREAEEIKRKIAEKVRLKKEREYKEAFYKEFDFWNDYIALLNANKINKAYKLLKTAACTKAYRAEIVKFKKGLFGFKYLGDVTMLQANELAKLAVEDLK